MTTKTLNRGLAVLSTLALTASLAACSDESEHAAPTLDATSTTEDESPAETPSPSPSPEASNEPTADPDGDGSRANPFRIGMVGQTSDWRVWVIDTVFDAGDIVAQENQFNDPADDGNVFVMVTIGIERLSDEAENPWMRVSPAIVGGNGRTYDDSCGVIPNPMRDIGDMYGGAEATANWCTEIPESALDGATLRVQLGLIGGAEGFFELGSL